MTENPRTVSSRKYYKSDAIFCNLVCFRIFFSQTHDRKIKYIGLLIILGFFSSIETKKYNTLESDDQTVLVCFTDLKNIKTDFKHESKSGFKTSSH